jgi:hypothetical protein
MSRRHLSLGVLILSLAVSGGVTSATYAGRTSHRSTSHQPAATPPATAQPASHNPLLPPPILLSNLFPDLSLIQTFPTIAPAGFEPLYTADDWKEYRAQFGAEADALKNKRSSVVAEFSKKLTEAAESESTKRPGLARLLFFRAAAICHRNRDGYEPANRAVMAYQKIMNIHSPTQVGALWTITNAMSKLAVTPKPERIRYSGIAARANTQLAILLLQADQIEAADSIIRQVGYHEGWLKSDPHIRAVIAQTRTVVRQTITMMDYLATQYQPAIKGDDSALMALFIYGRFVKNDPQLVADFPSRKPNSPMAELAAALAAGERDPMANYNAAEMLRNVAQTMPEGVLRSRTMYASLERYRSFLKSPETQRERVKRTLAVMAIETAVSEGARKQIEIRPFDDPKPTETATQPHVAAPVTSQPARDPGIVG